MTRSDEQTIERACLRLMALYARYVDAFDVEAFAALFAEDAELLTPSGRSTGRERIARGFARRDPAIVSRHVITNPIVEVESADAARGACYLTLYRTPPLAPDGPSGLSPALVGEYRDIYRRTEAGWLIARRELLVAFGA